MAGEMTICLIALSILGAAAPAQTNAQAPAPSRHVAKILSKGDGRSEQTAYKVASVHDEYEVLAALGLTSDRQSLVIKKKPYDVLDAKDPRTGEVRQIWFDISSFYPEFQF
jgi:uncharacterized protein DUF4919